jgi:chromosome segregation ATPase
MNSFGFFLRRIAWQFGFKRERQRWGAVNRETQILSEAEDLLGRLAWRDVKEIDELSGEYWQILDIDEQQEKLRQETRETDARCEALKAQLEEIQGREDQKVLELKEQKAKRMDEALALMREIEELKEWKEVTKRKFVTLKAKLKVIRKHEGEEIDLHVEIEKTKAAMAKLKQDFATDLGSIQSKTETVEAIEKKVDEIEKEVVASKTKVKADTADLANEVSRLSKQIAELSAKIGHLENTKADFFYQIGHFLSNNIDNRDRTIRATLRKHRQLVSRIAYFRRSIAFNQRLARRTNP